MNEDNFEKLTLGKFKELTKDLPDNTPIMYHSYYKGCGLDCYDTKEFWICKDEKDNHVGIVINPGGCYDERKHVE